MEEKIIKGIKYRLNEETLTAKVIQKKGYSGDIVIPDTVVSKKVSYKVTSIGDCAFKDCETLISISIPNSVKIIGTCAFECCTSLTSITIPDSVKTIDNNVFNWCKSLASITIPNSVTTITMIL